MNKDLCITPNELLARYHAGERNFAGIDLAINARALCDANLSNTIWSGTYLAGATLTRCDLRGAQLVGAYWCGAWLVETNLSDANLTGATLTNTILWGANLTRAQLLGANLSGAKLYGANLTDANLRESILCQVGLFGVKFDPGYPRQLDCTGALLWNTTLPDGTFVAGPTYYQPSTHSGC